MYSCVFSRMHPSALVCICACIPIMEQTYNSAAFCCQVSGESTPQEIMKLWQHRWELDGLPYANSRECKGKCWHNFSPFENHHTKPPHYKLPTYTLSLMSKVLRLLSHHIKSSVGCKVLCHPMRTNGALSRMHYEPACTMNAHQFIWMHINLYECIWMHLPQNAVSPANTVNLGMCQNDIECGSVRIRSIENACECRV